MRARTLIAGLAAACLLATATSASAAVRHVTIDGANGPGPAKYNKVFVSEFGPAVGQARARADARDFVGGAGDFTLDAEYLVKQVPNLQVWAIDRRSQALEDTASSSRRWPAR